MCSCVPIWRRAVSIHVRALGPGHEDTAASTRELARVLAQQGHAAEAEKHYRRALGGWTGGEGWRRRVAGGHGGGRLAASEGLLVDNNLSSPCLSLMQ